jgi:hypothetical protein
VRQKPSLTATGEAPRSSSASEQGIAYRVRASVSLTCNVRLDGDRDE